MVTLLVYAALAVIVVTALVVLAVVVLPATEQLAPAPPDRSPWSLPGDRSMSESDVGRLRLPVTLRGYRFAETDAVLDRLGEEIAQRDRVIASLQAELAGGFTELGETPEESDGDTRGSAAWADTPEPAEWAHPAQPAAWPHIDDDEASAWAYDDDEAADPPPT